MMFSSRQHLEMSRKMAAVGDHSRAGIYRLLSKLAEESEKAKPLPFLPKSPPLVPKARASRV